MTVFLPTLRQLQFFTALVRQRSFSRAAEECFVSQSTLSTGVKELESALGRQLVDRSGRAFGLTPAGEEAAARAAKILALTEDMARAVASRGPLEGPFHLGVIPTIAPFVLPAATSALREKYPKLTLYLREELTETLVARLGAGELDAALLAFPYDIPGAEVIHIADDPFWFATEGGRGCDDASAPVTLETVQSEQLLLLEDGHCLRDHAMEACNLRPPEAAAYGATSLFTLAQMVRAGVGATLLPEMAVRAGFAEASGLCAQPIADPTPKRKIGLAWRSGSGRAEEATAIAEAIAEAIDGAVGAASPKP
ncbi:MAG: hydrogen peroxide-inducible genes activator [Pseudomonadota bacterium]